jgi:CSLREA domain-containing protein
MYKRSSLLLITLMAALVLSILPAATIPVRAQEGSDAIAPAQTNVGFTFKVNTFTDEWDTDTNTKHKTKCSLREALQATFNSNVQGNQGCGSPGAFDEYRIEMNAGTYLLTRPEELPHVNVKVVIDGKKSVTIDGNTASRDKGIFTVGSEGLLILENITLQNGRRGAGGAIYSQGDVTLREATFKKNAADIGNKTGQGGAIYSSGGDLIIIKSKFEENRSDDKGGAIYSGASLVLVDRSEFLDNRAFGNGGAWANTGASESFPTIRDSKFQGNRVIVQEVPNGYEPKSDSHGGGAIWSNGKMLVEKTQFYQNYTRRAKGGGAIHNQGEIRFQDVAMAENEAKIDGDFPNSFGGAILNEGDMYLVRTSIHHNTAKFAGAAMNRLGADLFVINSTVAENSAGVDAGLVSGHPFLDSGGTIHVYHSTVVFPEEGTGSPNAPSISAESDYNIIIANSIVDNACDRPIYTGGYNLFHSLCPRLALPGSGANELTDQTGVDPFDAGLTGMIHNGGPNFSDAIFASYKLQASGAAVDVSGAVGCEYPLVEAVDQVMGARPNGQFCDAGSMEVGSQPPKLKSAPAAPGGVLIFPAVFLNDGASSSETTLEIENNGGGLFLYQAQIDESWNNTFELIEGAEGGLGKNQKKTLKLRCTPKGQGSYYGMLLVSTDMQDQPEARYKLTCHSPSLSGPSVGAQQQPGPVSSGQAAAGEQTMVSTQFTNYGNQPVNASYSWKQTAGNIWEIVASKAAVSAASGNASITIEPGETLNLDLVCKPTGVGLLVNTMELLTDDPANPVINYDVSCEGIVKPNPEPVALSDYSMEGGIPGKSVMGLAISPDGKQLLTGYWNNTGVGVSSINPNSGQTSLQTVINKAGMGGVSAIKYSHDGKNVYYSSMIGDGVVVADRAGDGSLSISQSITRTNVYLCGFTGNPNFPFIFCPIGGMDNARALDISPDDKNVYVTGIGDSTLVVLNRNPADGKLSFSQKFTNTIQGENVLQNPFAVVVSHDGANVYVGSSSGDNISVFARHENGLLGFRTVYRNGVNGINGLDDVRYLALSPDDAYLYAAGYASDSLVVFRRSPVDGSLEYVQTLPGIDGPYAISISHDLEGERLLAAAWNGDAIHVYGRNWQTGELTFLEQLKDTNNPNNLNGPVNLVSSADDRNVYAALFDTGSLRRLVSVRHAPLLYNVSPASVPAGSGDAVITVNGARFAADSVVLWNGAALPTIPVNDHQLVATVAAGLVAGAGQVNIQVRTPTPGGGDSSAIVFAITTPEQAGVPSITSLSPEAAKFGGEALNVVVNGANFSPESQALLNGAPVKTTFVNPQMLLVELAASDLSAPGPLAISVVNGSVVLSADANQMLATESTPLKFTTAQPNTPAAPSISSFQPASIQAGAPEMWLTVKGHNFSSLADALTVAYWNGDARQTVVQDEQTLRMLVSDVDLLTASQAKVTVYTPGLNESTPAFFTVYPQGNNPTPLIDTFVTDMEEFVILTVSGSDFVGGAEVWLNGAPMVTTVANPYQVSAQLTLADLASGGAIRVINPGPGGGASNTLVLPPSELLFLPVITRE